MIETINDFYELNKILRSVLLEQTNLPEDHVLNGLSIKGSDLEKRLINQIFVPFKIDDSFIVFNLDPRDSNSDISQTIDEKVNIVSSFTYKLIIYGKSSMLTSRIIKSRFESEEVRQILFNKGIYIENISNSQPVNEFINSTLWLRTDVDIDISCETNIEKITPYFEFEKLGKISVNEVNSDIEKIDYTEVYININEETGKTVVINGYTLENAPIDWGDGEIDDRNFHDYEEYGDYIIKIKGFISNDNGGFFARSDSPNLSIKSIKFYDDKLGEYGLAYCKDLEEVIFSNKEIYIPSYSFCETGINQIILPEEIETIKEGAFYKAENLVSITLDSKVKEIESYAFEGCKSLVNINLNKVLRIGEDSFKDCTSLISVQINNIISLNQGAFKNCTKLSSITIPQNITVLKTEVFNGCTALTINLSINIKSIEYLALNGVHLVNYSGTRNQWNEIEKSPEWGNPLVHCIDD